MQRNTPTISTDKKTAINNSKKSDLPHSERIYDFEESPRSKEERLLIKKQSDKTKISKENRRELGFEYDNDITSDIQLCQKILESGSYTASFENMIDFSEDLSRIIETSRTGDSRNAGTMIGMTVFGVIGFVALSFTIVGAIAGGLLGVGMGRYAGRKISKKMKRKKKFTNEELFRLKLQCLVQMGKIQQTEMQHNLNKYRLQLEKILQEFAYVFDLTLFSKPKKISTILTKFRNFLLGVTNQKAILLSFKLFKNYLKLIQNDKIEIEKETISKVYSVFLPFKKALEFNTKKDKKLEKLTSYSKIKAFIEKPWVKEILSRKADPNADPVFLQNFKSKLKEPVDLEEKIGQALKWDRKTVKEVINKIEEPKKEKTHSPLRKPNSPIPKPIEKFSPHSKLKQASGKWDELQVGRVRSKTLDDDLDEGVSVAMKTQNINYVKQHSHKFRLGSFSPAQSLNALPDDPDPGQETLLMRNASQPVRGNHNLEHPGLGLSYSSGKPPRASAGDAKGKSKYQLDIDSSEDSSLDEENNEEEQKLVEEDSYLFLKSQVKNTHREFDFHPEHGIDIPMTNSIIKNNNEFQDHAGEYRGRTSMDLSRRQHTRPMSEARKGPGKEQPMSHLVKMNSDPDIEDVDLEPSSRESLDDGRQIKLQPVENSGPRDELEPLQAQNLNLQLGVHKTETSKSALIRKTIDTKQEIVFQKLMSITADTHSKWDIIKNDKELKVFKIKPENSDVVLIRAWAYLPDATPSQLFNCIYDTKIRAKWDTVLSNPHVVEKIDEFNDVFYFCVKAPFAVSNRDFVQKRCVRYDYPEQGDIIISFQSMTHPKAPPIKGTVRGDTHIAGYILKPSKTGQGAELHLVTQVDVKGSIPKMVVNLVAGRAPAEWITKLKKACQTFNK